MDYSQKAPTLRIMSPLVTCLKVPEREWYQSDASSTGPIPTEQHNVVTALQNVASLHAVQLCYSVDSSLCNVVNGTRKAVNCNVVVEVVQRCQSLSSVVQCCHTVAKRYPTLCNVVTKLCVVVSKLCNVSSCTTLPLSNAVQRCQTLYNAVQRCNNVTKRYITLCNVVTTLPNGIQRCATL